ncbi:HAD family hydrolase [Gemella haemolysans]|uniref:HAD family hydrolase n=1 Tax=Gemella haemolysans TaxID=1379 RepID=UPI0019584164|nr:HAD family phosphatase [Gemella haemolysans]VTX61961.1 Phosphorylated carbohydrates phosphatase [Gemella haemolysans]
MDIKAVLFDMDGLMVDTESLATQAFIHSAKKQGYDMTKEETLLVLGFTTKNIYDFWENYFKDSNVSGKKLVDNHYKYIENVLFTTGPEKMPYIEELLKYLKGNSYKVAVASSSNMDHIINNMEKTGLKKYIDEFASGAEVENGKPAPDVFLLAAKRLGVKPENCLVLEDSKAGVIAGSSAGAKVIMVPDMFKPDAECKEKAYKIVNNLGEVISILEEKNNENFNR